MRKIRQTYNAEVQILICPHRTPRRTQSFDPDCNPAPRGWPSILATTFCRNLIVNHLHLILALIAPDSEIRVRSYEIVTPLAKRIRVCSTEKVKKVRSRSNNQKSSSHAAPCGPFWSALIFFNSMISSAESIPGDGGIRPVGSGQAASWAVHS